MLISITGSNEELKKIWEKLKEATPHLKHEAPSPCSNTKMGSISLFDQGTLTYYNALGWEKMEFYDKRYMLNNINHFAHFMWKVKEVHDKLKEKG